MCFFYRRFLLRRTDVLSSVGERRGFLWNPSAYKTCSSRRLGCDGIFRPDRKNTNIFKRLMREYQPFCCLLEENKVKNPSDFFRFDVFFLSPFSPLAVPMYSVGDENDDSERNLLAATAWGGIFRPDRKNTKIFLGSFAICGLPIFFKVKNPSDFFQLDVFFLSPFLHLPNACIGRCSLEQRRVSHFGDIESPGA